MKKNKEKVYKTIEEIEKKFFPGVLKEPLEETDDIKTRAIIQADEFLERIKKELID